VVFNDAYLESIVEGIFYLKQVFNYI